MLRMFYQAELVLGSLGKVNFPQLPCKVAVNSYYHPRWCRARRRDSELSPEVDRRATGIGNDEVGKEKYMPTDLVMVPIMVNLMLIFIFIFVGAIMFTIMEGKNAYSEVLCFYFHS